MTYLGEVNGARNLQLVVAAIFNCWGIKVYGISIDACDTVFKYQIQTDEKLKVNERKSLTKWLHGFVTALKAVE